MAEQDPAQATTAFKIGDLVRIKDKEGQVARISDYRGPIGPGGAAVYRVKVNKKSMNSFIELLGDQLEPLSR